MNTKRTLVIFNPASRGEKSLRARKFVETKAKGDPAITLAPTERTGDAEQLAAQAASQGYDTVVAAGGDGTINEVINGIADSKLTLGIFPVGTINVFALELGIPFRLEKAWALLHTGESRLIDLGCAESNGARRRFAQLAGVGLDAISVRQTSWELKKKIGPWSYIWAGLKTVALHRADVEVTSDRTEQNKRGVLVLVGNGRLYGGRFSVFPKAKLDDGLLDVCIFENGGYGNVLRYVQGAWRGIHTGFRDVTYFQTERFTCNASTAVPFEVDGEVAGEVPVRFSVLPRALRVIGP